MFASSVIFIVWCSAVLAQETHQSTSSDSARNASLRHRTSRSRMQQDAVDQIFRGNASGRQQCSTDQIEYRLTRLEVQVAEKAENLRSELREGNRRLQALEWQSEEVKKNIEGFSREIERFTLGQHRPGPSIIRNGRESDVVDKLEAKVDTIAKGIQLAVAALRLVNSDMSRLRNNITFLANATNQLLQTHNELVTKQFLTNRMLELKHHQSYPYVPDLSQLCHQEQHDAAKTLPKSCKDIRDKGTTASGIYKIKPDNIREPFMVLCDMEAREGGWLYIQNRYEGTQDFYLNWHSYKHGFGNLGGEFWLGLEHIYQLTGSELNELLIELVDQEGRKKYAHYAAFSISSELEGYRLKILGGYDGDAGDSLTYHAGMKFSTKDMDQDEWAEGSCAKSHGGAWWYRSCDTSNLNGKYLNGQLPDSYIYQGMYWNDFKGPQYSLMQARMMIRPRDENSPSIFPGGISSQTFNKN